MTTLPVSLSFENTELSIIDHDGKPWLSASDLAKALGYSRSDKVSNIYNRNKDEFTNDMTETLNLGVSVENNNLQTKTRIFSPRGCHLIAMFARTEKAKAFRVWALNVLDGIKFAAPQPEPTTINDKQYQSIRRAVSALEMNFHYKGSAGWAVYSKLREEFNVSPISQLPVEQLQPCLIRIEQMSKQAFSFKCAVLGIEKEFFKNVYRMGNNFDPEQIEKQVH